MTKISMARSSVKSIGNEAPIGHFHAEAFDFYGDKLVVFTEGNNFYSYSLYVVKLSFIQCNGSNHILVIENL